MTGDPRGSGGPTEGHHSAGGVVVRGGRVLLISPQRGRWQLPKGRIEPGETPQAAATREVREETGVTGRVVAPLPSIDYWYIVRGNRRIHKTVDYFLMDYLEGDPRHYDPREVEAARWIDWDEALAALSFDNERQVVMRARQLAGGGTGEP